MYKSSPSKIWRKFLNRYQLVGVKSTKSGKSYYPPVFVESDKNTKFKPEKLKKEGTLITWSEVLSPPEGYEQFKPYLIGIIELENGERLTAQIVDTELDQLKYGDKMVAIFRKYYEDGDDGVIHYGLKWRKV